MEFIEMATLMGGKNPQRKLTEQQNFAFSSRWGPLTPWVGTTPNACIMAFVDLDMTPQVPIHLSSKCMHVFGPRENLPTHTVETCKLHTENLLTFLDCRHTKSVFITTSCRIL